MNDLEASKHDGIFRVNSSPDPGDFTQTLRGEVQLEEVDFKLEVGV